MFASMYQRAVPVNPMLGHELKLSIGGRQRSLQASVQRAVGFNHDHAGSAPIGVAIGQPEEGRGLSVAARPGEREGLALRPHADKHAQGRRPPRPCVPIQRFALPRQMM
jgi:hypothetical protein